MKFTHQEITSYLDAQQNFEQIEALTAPNGAGMGGGDSSGGGGDIDGGAPDSVYGGTPLIDGNGVVR